MDPSELRFKDIKEGRDWYYVEYLTPRAGLPFASVQLNVLRDEEHRRRIAEAMEDEACHWLARYPIPVMVSAFDATGTLIQLEGARECDHLVAFVDPNGKALSLNWRLLSNDQMPHEQLEPDYLAKIYHDLPFRTGAEIASAAEQDQAKRRVGWLIVFLWAVVVPAMTAFLEWWSDWLA